VLAFSSRHVNQNARNDSGNIVAMNYRFHRRRDFERLPNNIAGIFGAKVLYPTTWLPVMEFPWWICFGTIVTFFIAILFRTGREHHPAGRAPDSKYQSRN